MKAFFMWLGLVAAFALSACGGGADDMADDYLEQINRISEATESVTDDASADAAVGEIAGAIEELNQLAPALSKMTDEERTQMFAANAEKFQQAQLRMQSAMQGLMVKNPQWLMKISAAMKDLPALK